MKNLFKCLLFLALVFTPQQFANAKSYDGLYIGTITSTEYAHPFNISAKVYNGAIEGEVDEVLQIPSGEATFQVTLKLQIDGNVSSENGALNGTMSGAISASSGDDESLNSRYSGPITGSVQDFRMNFVANLVGEITNCPEEVTCTASDIIFNAELNKTIEENEVANDDSPGQDLAGVDFPSITRVAGDVEIHDPAKRKGALETAIGSIWGENWQVWETAQDNIELKQGHQIKTGGGRAVITFEDGTRFTLKENSSLTVTPTGFVVDTGTVHFEVKKWGKHLVIADKRGRFGVTGTAFSVESNQNKTILVVYEGTVEAGGLNETDSQEVTAGQTIRVNSEGVEKVQEVANLNEISDEWTKIATDVEQSREGKLFPSKSVIAILGAVVGVLFLLGVFALLKRKVIIGILFLALSFSLGGYLLLGMMNVFQKVPNTKTQKEQTEIRITAEEPQTDTAEPETKETTKWSDEWLVYTDDYKGFSIEYPPYLNPDILPDGDVSFTKWGPTQKEDTEFYDGINIAFRTEPYEVSIREAVEMRKAVYEEVWGVPIEVQETEVNGYTGLTYESYGYKYIYLEQPDGWFLEISNMTQDPGNLGYEEVAEKMIQSIELL